MMSNNLHHQYHILPTIAILGALFSSILITTAYAQPPQQRGPCPEGFSLNRGVCQAEPELTCDSYNQPPEWIAAGRVIVDENGDCFVKEYTTAVCLNDDETQIIGYYFPSDECVGNVDGINQVIPNEEPACKDPTNPNHPINTATLTTERGGRPSIECVFLTELGPADEKCDNGRLNEDSGMCEVKPGRRSK